MSMLIACSPTDQAEQAAILRTAQNLSVEVTEPAVQSPTKTRHRRTSSIHENPFAPATGFSEDTYISTPSNTVDKQAESVYYEEPHASYTYYPERSKMPKDKKVPKPGPAKLGMNSTPKEWLQCALRNQYLPERIMKQLCESVKEKLMEGQIDAPLLSHPFSPNTDRSLKQSPTFSQFLLQSPFVVIFTVNSTTSLSCSASQVVFQAMKLSPKHPPLLRA